MDISKNIKNPPLNDQLIFQKICQFLKIQEVFKLMRVCKSYSELVNLYFKWILRSIGLLQEWDLENIAIEIFGQNQPIKYNIVYKYFHNREVLYTSLDHPIQKNNYQEMKVYRCRNHHLLRNKCIKDFNVGTKFCSFLTSEDELQVCKSNEFFTNQNPQFLTRKNVIKFLTKPHNLFYLTKAGTVCIIFYNEQQSCQDMQEIVLNWTLYFPVEDMAASYLFATFILREKEDQKEINKNTQLLQNYLQGTLKLNVLQNQNYISFNEQQQLQKQDLDISKEDTKRNIVIGYIRDMFIDQQDDFKRYKRITGYPYYNVKQFCVGFHNAYFLSPAGQIFDVDLSNFTNVDVLLPGQLRIQEMKSLQNKKIVKIFSGLTFYFALQREETLSVDNWNNDQVIKFIDQIGLADYKGIFKYAEVDGKILSTITKKYMIDTLGITKEDLQNKLLTEIGKYTQTVYAPYILWGWGKNESGQLGLIPCPNINQPVLIPLPQLDENDKVKIIECGWKNSIILTEKNQIWITDQTTKQQIDKQQSQQEGEEIKDSQSDDKKKQQKKTKQSKQKNIQKSSQKEVDDDENNRWINITAQFTILKDKRKYKIYDISTGKDTLSALGVCFWNKQLQNIQSELNEDSEDQKKRLTPIDKILNRIEWDEHLDKSQFSIVYEDRFLGDIEIKYEEYKNTEIKLHRIKIFKLNGVVVWDREKKLDLL